MAFSKGIRLFFLATYVSAPVFELRDKETEREKASKRLPPTEADSMHCLTLPKVSVDTKGTNAIWARRLRYIQRQKGLFVHRPAQPGPSALGVSEWERRPPGPPGTAGFQSDISIIFESGYENMNEDDPLGCPSDIMDAAAEPSRSGCCSGNENTCDGETMVKGEQLLDQWGTGW